jgi:hypothetical protein
MSQALRAAAAAAILALSACGPQEGGPNATPFDGNYTGQAWVVSGPAQCGGPTPNPNRLQVVNGRATILIRSQGFSGAIGPQGQLNTLRSTGMQALERASSNGQITGNRADVTIIQDLCTWRFQGTRGGI